MSDKIPIEKGYVPPAAPIIRDIPNQNGYVPPAAPVIRQVPQTPAPAQAPPTSKD